MPWGSDEFGWREGLEESGSNIESTYFTHSARREGNLWSSHTHTYTHTHTFFEQLPACMLGS